MPVLERFNISTAWILGNILSKQKIPSGLSAILGTISVLDVNTKIMPLWARQDLATPVTMLLILRLPHSLFCQG